MCNVLSFIVHNDLGRNFVSYGFLLKISLGGDVETRMILLMVVFFILSEKLDLVRTWKTQLDANLCCRGQCTRFDLLANLLITKQYHIDPDDQCL